LPQTEPVWLTPADLTNINVEEVRATGEPHVVSSQALLESAASRPLNLYRYGEEEDVVNLATALLFGVTLNHPFLQGNKRTGFTGALVFIEMNGYRWVGPDDPDLWGDLVVRVQNGVIPEADFSAELRPFVQ
tara:strand:- start:16961 stop:17356 length:396 start_codon:yes stop_codon:yes gene_type:complete